MPIYFKYKHSSVFSKRAFTLIELLVVITIATIIITALVVQQSRWSDTLAVNTQAYELSLALRQAQIYSLGVREDVGGSGDKFDSGYGIYFTHQQRDRYIFFADRDGDSTYDSGEAIEPVIMLKRGVTIQNFCGERVSNGNEVCSASGISCISSASITFKRPSTSALFSLTGNTSCTLKPQAKINLVSRNGKVSSVFIDKTGQISVDQ